MWIHLVYPDFFLRNPDQIEPLMATKSSRSAFFVFWAGPAQNQTKQGRPSREYAAVEWTHCAAGG